jgi:hypothetical protein
MRFLFLFLISFNLSANTLIPSLQDASLDVTLVADKKGGTLYVYNNETGQVIKNPALFGTNKGDVVDMNIYNSTKPSARKTPAGEYDLMQQFSLRLNEPILSFIRGTHKIGAIHPLWMKNPNQQRPQRLKSETPDDNRITNGCINVDPDFFYKVLVKIPNDTRLIILTENDTIKNIDDIKNIINRSETHND